jgi:hypothetical protein
MNKMKKILVPDTCILYSHDLKHYISDAYLREFKEIKDFEIIIPKIVIRELNELYKEKIKNNLDGLKRNPLSSYYNYDYSEDYEKECSNYINFLKSENKIKFEVFEFLDSYKLTAFNELVNLAIRYEAPFESRIDKQNKSNKSFCKANDKGFKDSVIVKSVEIIQKENPNSNVFFLTRDKKQIEYFSNQEQITVIESADDYYNFVNSNFYDFRDKLEQSDKYKNAKLYSKAFNMQDDIILEYKHNSPDNKISRVKLPKKEDEDIEEVLESGAVDLKTKINKFVNSGSYENTYSSAHELKDFVLYFTRTEIINIIDALISNHEISDTVLYSNSRTFFTILFNEIQKYNPDLYIESIDLLKKASINNLCIKDFLKYCL